MKVSQPIVIFTLLLLGVLRINAQTTVSLKDAVNMALENNVTIKNAKLDIEKGREVVKETRAAALPQITGTSSVTINPIVMQFVLPAAAMGGPEGEFIAIKAGQTWGAVSQVQLSQQIFNQQVFTGLKAAKTSEEYYQLLEASSKENIAQSVAAAYYQVLTTRQGMQVIDANLSRVEKLANISRNLFENGLGKKIDVDRLVVNKTNLEVQKQQLEASVKLQENLLKYYMGMPVATEIVLDATSFSELEAGVLSIAPSARIDVGQLSAFKVLKKQEELLELNKQAIKAENIPTLALNGNYTYNSQSNKFNVYGKNALNYDMSSISLNLRVPIFDGNSRRARVKQADIDLYKLRNEVVNTENSLNMGYINAKIQLENNIKSLTAQKANKGLAEEVFTNVESNYRLGLATLTDLLNAQTDLVTAENSYNEALLNFKVAEVELLKASGAILTLATN